MLACVCQPVSSKQLYSSTKTNIRKLNKPPVRVIRITNSVPSKLDTDVNRNVLLETSGDVASNKAKSKPNGMVAININNNRLVKTTKCKINRFKSISSSSSESEQSDNASYCSTCSKSGCSSSSREEVVTTEPKRTVLFERNEEKEVSFIRNKKKKMQKRSMKFIDRWFPTNRLFNSHKNFCCGFSFRCCWISCSGIQLGCVTIKKSPGNFSKASCLRRLFVIMKRDNDVPSGDNMSTVNIVQPLNGFPNGSVPIGF